MSRVGTFSSSSISDLMSKGRGNWSIENLGAPFKTYVEEKEMEHKLGRSITTENNARSTAWGTLVEEQAFSKMDLKYSLVSKERFYHKEFKKYWSGMPDILTDDIVGDIKCPYTLKSFCKLVKNMGSVETFKENHSDYYWQLVSNAILCGKDEAMLIVYVPFKEDLEDIKELARTKGEELDNRFAFINWATDEDLPYLIKGNHYNDINTLTFKIPQEDKDMLTDRVKMAVNQLKESLK
jgi:hypothetical protein